MRKTEQFFVLLKTSWQLFNLKEFNLYFKNTELICVYCDYFEVYDIEKLKNSNSNLFTTHFAVARTLAVLPASFYSRSDKRPKENFCFGAY